MIEFYEEADITESDDRKLIDLLLLCFPMVRPFGKSRYWLEPCHYRWLIRDGDRIVADVVVHDKTVLAEEREIRIAGIACVCVHPDFRGRGLVKQMLSEVHAWARDHGFSFAFLFGKKEFYQSSGYIQCENEFRVWNHQKDVEEVKPIENARYVSLTGEPWPTSLVDLQGPIF